MGSRAFTKAERSAGPLWVKRVGFVMSAIYPVYPKQQTFLDPVGTSHLCQQLTYRRPASLSSSRSCLAAIRSAVPKLSPKAVVDRLEARDGVGRVAPMT
jgi:hypothetical protein